MQSITRNSREVLEMEWDEDIMATHANELPIDLGSAAKGGKARIEQDSNRITTITDVR